LTMDAEERTSMRAPAGKEAWNAGREPGFESPGLTILRSSASDSRGATVAPRASRRDARDMRAAGCVALVIGADRALGSAIAGSLVGRGAERVYGAARDHRSVTEPGVVGVSLDVTSPGNVAEAAARLADVDTVIIDGGFAALRPPLAASLIEFRRDLEVRYLGLLAVVQAFAPVLAENGGGALVNVLTASTQTVAHAATRATLDALRAETRASGTLVVNVQIVPTGLPMAPAWIATATLNALAAGRDDVMLGEPLYPRASPQRAASVEVRARPA
jgi:NAD(P)-dependent dehydrogenase (short-subunit alcohol dehydrogenase family)